ncbi:DUF4249 domain-containing protein [uncultured Wocania sp.]|uniref:DUF4249 domain-containing protein n=1 Tax=uncultured Wocania sp. TaxID=2834404 RepID=UPI0030FA3F60
MKHNRTYCLAQMLTTFFVISCTEPFNLKSIDFEDTLIIEAIITDEVKHQEIKLSRTFSLEEFTPSKENNAQVMITDDNQNTFEFEETSTGVYTSKTAFGASPNSAYTLTVITNNGKTYKSQPTKAPNTVPINSLYASVEIDKDTGNENISIYIDGFNGSSSSKYFRYEYEETYKILASSWVAGEFIVSSTGQLSWGELCCRPPEKRVCYNTVASDSIIQLKVENTSLGNPSAFPVRVIHRDNPVIRTRYSILVKQYAQSLEAFTFYKTLNKFSSSEDVFSQNQPGFFNGNLFSVENSKEKVVGYFDISSVSTERIFFNFSDFFPNEPLPPYFEDCTIFQINDISKLTESVINNKVVFHSLVPDQLPNVVNASCGDCTKIGTTTKPDFWVD